MFTFAIPFPNIDPVIFRIGSFPVAWYGVAYLVGIYLAWQILMRVVKKDSYPHPSIQSQHVDDFLLYAVLGVVVGGRIFGTLVYNWDIYSRDLLSVFWPPPYAGMSFHGGFLGVVVAAFYISRKHKFSPRAFGDLLAMVAPIGLFFGRLANFINAELWGKSTTVPWAVEFPGVDAQAQCIHMGAEYCARHPSQLYEAGLEGLLLGLIMFALYRLGALKYRGMLTGVFFLGYGLARMFVELFRNADNQFIDAATNPLGHVIRFGDFGLSMGQTLSLPMVLIGLAFIWYSRKNP